MIKKLFLVYVVGSFLLFGCGDRNIFDWSHDEGGNKSASALASDGEAAYKKGEYAKAYKYYQEAANKEPGNSEILYGLAKAAYGANGITLSTLTSSFLDNLKNSNSPNLPYNAFNMVGGTGDIETGVLPMSGSTPLLPSTFNSTMLKNLFTATNAIISALGKIADGKADGKIPSDDPSVNIHLGIALVLNSVLLVLDSNCDGTPCGPDDLIKLDDITNNFALAVPSQLDLDNYVASLTTAQKQKFLENIRLAIFQLIGQWMDGYPQDTVANRSAVNYFQTAKSSNSSQKTGTLEDLIKSFTDLAGNSDTENIKKFYKNLKTALGL